MTATGTSEMQDGSSPERVDCILGESNVLGDSSPAPHTGLPAYEVRSAEETFEDSWEGSLSLPCQVELTPQGGKDLAEELSFNENPVAIVESEGLSAMGQAAIARGYLWILLRTPGPQHRGRLGLYIEETIENQLEERGALPPGIHASTGLDASLSDQLYRARLVEMRGIALGIPSLEGITNLGRVLDAEDSAVLRWWMAATSDRPVRMVLSNENTKLRVYPSPVLFQSLFEVAPGSVTPLPPSPSMAESAGTMELSDLPPLVEVKQQAETNVFGTEVATWESSPHEFNVDESVSERSVGDDVALPDLDRALGLSPPLAPSAPVVERSDVNVRRASSRVRPGTQLELSGLDTAPVAAGPNAQAVLAELEAEATQAMQENEQLPASAAASLPEEESLPEEIVERGAVSSPSVASQHLSLHDESAQADVWSGDATDIDELDTEEFLRTLEEDSSRAPEVQADVQAASHPTPLPTKKILRNAFIRLADPSLAVSDESVEKSNEGESQLAAVALQDVQVLGETGDDASLSANISSQDAASRETSQGTDEVLVAESVATAEPVGDTAEPVDDTAERDLLTAQTKPTAGFDAPNVHTKSRLASGDPGDAFNQLAAREWKTWVRNLEAARGPKPLSVIERMFVTDYTRLREAVRRGVADTSANGILDEWQGSFTTSYSEAFDALRVRGKRPTMVLDLPELAARLGRLQGARRVQLLLVDGLRFDLGLMVQERMRSSADASLTERLLLWSALPSVTSYQLELLGKGPDGLKEPGDVDEPPALVARGAAARSPRRVRTGSLELLKLDVVADAIRQPGPPILERMDAIADETASAIVEHLSKQAPRTMVVVFGDHGFAIDPSASGTTEEVKQGGASPEEVLVPAFAWLTGAVH